MFGIMEENYELKMLGIIEEQFVQLGSRTDNQAWDIDVRKAEL